ncbi:hypothetical protein ACHAWF_008985 [Thalassiosira exigua]
MKAVLFSVVIAAVKTGIAMASDEHLRGNHDANVDGASSFDPRATYSGAYKEVNSEQTTKKEWGTLLRDDSLVQEDFDVNAVVDKDKEDYGIIKVDEDESAEEGGEGKEGVGCFLGCRCCDNTCSTSCCPYLGEDYLFSGCSKDMDSCVDECGHKRCVEGSGGCRCATPNDGKCDAWRSDQNLPSCTNQDYYADFNLGSSRSLPDGVECIGSGTYHHGWACWKCGQ